MTLVKHPQKPETAGAVGMGGHQPQIKMCDPPSKDCGDH
jgi:hypothetical protein